MNKVRVLGVAIISVVSVLGCSPGQNSASEQKSDPAAQAHVQACQEKYPDINAASLMIKSDLNEREQALWHCMWNGADSLNSAVVQS